MRGRACDAIQVSSKLKGWDPTDFIKDTYTFENLDCNHPIEPATHDLQPTNPAVVEPEPWVPSKKGGGATPYPGMDMGY